MAQPRFLEDEEESDEDFLSDWDWSEFQGEPKDPEAPTPKDAVPAATQPLEEPPELTQEESDEQFLSDWDWSEFQGGDEDKPPASQGDLSDLFTAGIMGDLSTFAQTPDLLIRAEQVKANLKGQPFFYVPFSLTNAATQVYHNVRGIKNPEYARKRLQERSDSIKAAIARGEEADYSPHVKAAIEHEGLGDMFEAIAEHPYDVITEVGARSLGPSAVAAGVGAAGGAAVAGGGALIRAAGFGLGLGSGSGAMEYAGAILEEFNKKGVDVGDAQQVMDAVNDKEWFLEAQKKALVSAAIVGITDAATGGVATKTIGLGKSTLAKEATNWAFQTAVQMLGGGGGEAAKQMATEGKLHWGRIGAETAGELVTTPVDIGAATLSGARENKQARAKKEVEAHNAELANRLGALRLQEEDIRKRVKDAGGDELDQELAVELAKIDAGKRPPGGPPDDTGGGGGGTTEQDILTWHEREQKRIAEEAAQPDEPLTYEEQVAEQEAAIKEAETAARAKREAAQRVAAQKLDLDEKLKANPIKFRREGAVDEGAETQEEDAAPVGAEREAEPEEPTAPKEEERAPQEPPTLLSRAREARDRLTGQQEQERIAQRQGRRNELEKQANKLEARLEKKENKIARAQLERVRGELNTMNAQDMLARGRAVPDLRKQRQEEQEAENVARQQRRLDIENRIRELERGTDEPNIQKRVDYLNSPEVQEELASLRAEQEALFDVNRQEAQLPVQDRVDRILRDEATEETLEETKAARSQRAEPQLGDVIPEDTAAQLRNMAAGIRTDRMIERRTVPVVSTKTAKPNDPNATPPDDDDQGPKPPPPPPPPPVAPAGGGTGAVPPTDNSATGLLARRRAARVEPTVTPPAAPTAPAEPPGGTTGLANMGIASGMTGSLYKQLYDAHAQGKTKMAGMEDSVLWAAKASRANIKSPEDMRLWVANNQQTISQAARDIRAQRDPARYSAPPKDFTLDAPTSSEDVADTDEDAPLLAHNLPNFYSQVERTIETLRVPGWSQGKSLPAEQILSKIASSPGVKKEELKWTGLLDMTESVRGTGQRITKDELLEFVRMEREDIEESVVTNRNLRTRVKAEIAQTPGELQDVNMRNRGVILFQQGKHLIDAPFIGSNGGYEGMFREYFEKSKPSNMTYDEAVEADPIRRYPVTVSGDLADAVMQKTAREHGTDYIGEIVGSDTLGYVARRLNQDTGNAIYPVGMFRTKEEAQQLFDDYAKTIASDIPRPQFHEGWTNKNLPPPKKDSYHEVRVKAKQGPRVTGKFNVEGHFEDDNVIGFLRGTERKFVLADGSIVTKYVGEEAQSDPHQRAQKIGYQGDPDTFFERFVNSTRALANKIMDATIADLEANPLPFPKLNELAREEMLLGLRGIENALAVSSEEFYTNGEPYQIERAMARLHKPFETMDLTALLTSMRDEPNFKKDFDATYRRIRNATLDTPAEVVSWQDNLLTGAYDRVGQYDPDARKVPDLPMRGDAWQRMLMRRMIVEAVQRGHKSVSWNDALSSTQIYKPGNRKPSGGAALNYDKKWVSMFEEITGNIPYRESAKELSPGTTKLSQAASNVTDQNIPAGWTAEDIAGHNAMHAAAAGLPLVGGGVARARNSDPRESQGGLWTGDIPQEMIDAIKAGEEVFPLYAKAFHGTPHTIRDNQFLTSKIGTGEGAQVRGDGLYFSSAEAIAEHYRITLSSKPPQRGIPLTPQELKEYEALRQQLITAVGSPSYNSQDPRFIQQLKRYGELKYKLEYGGNTEQKGNLYQAEIPDESSMLDWDKPIPEQSEKVLTALGYDPATGNSSALDMNIRGMTGGSLYGRLVSQNRMTALQRKTGREDARAVSNRLRDLGIPGNTYIGHESGKRNYVVFHEDDISDVVNLTEKRTLEGRTEEERVAHKDKLTGKYKEATVLRTPSELPRSTVEDAAGLANKTPEAYLESIKGSLGMWDPTDGVVYMFSDNIVSEEMAEEVYAHEYVAHKGIDAMVPDREEMVALYNSIYDSVVNGGDAQQKALMARVVAGYKLQPANKPNHKKTAAQEYVAKLAQQGYGASTLQRVVDFVREQLRKMNFVREWSDSDIRALLRKSAKGIVGNTNKQVEKRCNVLEDLRACIG